MLHASRVYGLCGVNCTHFQLDMSLCGLHAVYNVHAVSDVHAVCAVAGGSKAAAAAETSGLIRGRRMRLGCLWLWWLAVVEPPQQQRQWQQQCRQWHARQQQHRQLTTIACNLNHSSSGNSISVIGNSSTESLPRSLAA